MAYFSPKSNITDMVQKGARSNLFVNIFTPIPILEVSGALLQNHEFVEKTHKKGQKPLFSKKKKLEGIQKVTSI